MDSLSPGSGLPPTGGGLPTEGRARNGPLLAREVPEATDPALDALRRLWTRLGSSPGPAWASAEYCLEVPGQPRPSSPLCGSVWLSMRRAVQAVTNVRSGCGGRGYLVFWRSSRSQVGSVWPILYSSLESSMLWSR